LGGLQVPIVRSNQ